MTVLTQLRVEVGGKVLIEVKVAHSCLVRNFFSTVYLNERLKSVVPSPHDAHRTLTFLVHYLLAILYKDEKAHSRSILFIFK
jgi:hypothetical protein